MIPFDICETPCHVIDLDKLYKNLSILKNIRKEVKSKILFAIKGFSCDSIFPILQHYLDGISASGLFEARIGREKLDKLVSTYSPSFEKRNIVQISNYSNYVIFNSISQWNSFYEIPLKLGCNCGLRINPEYSEVKEDKINHCHEFSRFGIRAQELSQIEMRNVSGFLMHNMCEQNVDVLEKTLKVLENNFNEYLQQIHWLNIGGGQLFTNEKYDTIQAEKVLKHFQDKYGFEIILEPCTAVMLNTGYLVSTVIDIVNNGIQTAILDASAVCHIPDIINFPYRSEIIDDNLLIKPYTYRLSGPTCYAGDIFGDYNFSRSLSVGSKVVFKDTAQYTMVKSNMFNGLGLPNVYFYSSEKGYIKVKEYGYDDFLRII